ncbi:MAG: hypothetical protein ABH833_00825 [Parcubacteria group bacterium]
MTHEAITAQPEILSLFVHDDIAVLEVYGATSCSFVVIGGVSLGYQYVETRDFEDNLSRAYDVIFDETLKRFESEGAHLSL